MYEWFIAPLSALVSILVGLYFYRYVNKQDSGTERMKEISGAIKEGAAAFIRREYTTLAIFMIIVAIIMLIFLPSPLWLNSEPLKNIELASGEVAMARSPIPPVRASGEILRKGTAVVTTFNLSDCPNAAPVHSDINKIPKPSLEAVDLIRIVLK